MAVRFVIFRSAHLEWVVKMKDQFDRTIDYLRISITDRCNLRCIYCMPEGIDLETHDDILRFEEFLRICRIAVSLGITKFKITGGEPLVRRGCTDFVAAMKAVPGVEQVTMTTNGLLLPMHLNAVCGAGLDGVNISLDSLDPDTFAALTGSSPAMLGKLRENILACVARGLRVKINSVMLDRNFQQLPDIVQLAGEVPIDVRFIELMPIGEGQHMQGGSMDDALALFRRRWPDLRPTDETRGNGPARYFKSDKLLGRVGFISAMSHEFCGGCNRVRLTAKGMLKPCLCYEAGVDLRAPLRRRDAEPGDIEAELYALIQSCILHKPQQHHFRDSDAITEHKSMHEIGG